MNELQLLESKGTMTSLKKLENIFRRNNDNKRATGKRDGTRGNQGTGGK